MCSDRFRIPPHPTRIGVGSGSPPHPTRIGVGSGRGGVAPTHGFKGKPHFLRGRGALLAVAFQYTRSHCLYTLAGLRETVPLSLSQDASEVPQRLADSEELPVVGLLKQRRFARISCIQNHVVVTVAQGDGDHDMAWRLAIRGAVLDPDPPPTHFPQRLSLRRRFWTSTTCFRLTFSCFPT